MLTPGRVRHPQQASERWRPRAAEGPAAASVCTLVARAARPTAPLGFRRAVGRVPKHTNVWVRLQRLETAPNPLGVHDTVDNKVAGEVPSVVVLRLLHRGRDLRIDGRLKLKFRNAGKRCHRLQDGRMVRRRARLAQPRGLAVGQHRWTAVSAGAATPAHLWVCRACSAGHAACPPYPIPPRYTIDRTRYADRKQI